jgi:Cu2+-containing amine oxidase
MRFLRYAACVLAGAAAAAAVVVLAGAPTDPQPKPEQPSTKSPYEIIQEFPTSGPKKESAWKVRWAQATAKGLYITGAWFRKGPTEKDWVKVLGDARVSDIFVPYHGFKYDGFENTRFWDLSNYKFDLLAAIPSDTGPRGEIIGDPPVVVKELRDRGVMWKDHDGGMTQRGEELVLWATLEAGNYAYIMQYSFQDDGSFKARLGATAHNYPNGPLESHVHNALWRIDVDLADPNHNSVYLMKHIAPKPGGNPLQAEDDHRLFNGGVEGWADWNPEEFTMLEVQNTKKVNAAGGHWAYDLMPVRMGSGREHGGDYEDCTLHDFYVTRSPSADGKPDDELDFKLLLKKYINDQSIKDTDVVLWHVSSMHHEPRAEDGKYVKDEAGNWTWRGVTLVMWGGFDLVPRNLWDQTPFYPYDEQGK